MVTTFIECKPKKSSKASYDEGLVGLVSRETILSRAHRPHLDVQRVVAVIAEQA